MSLGFRDVPLLTVKEPKVEATVQRRLRITHLSSSFAHVLVRFPQQALPHADVAQTRARHGIHRILAKNLVENLESFVILSCRITAHPSRVRARSSLGAR